MLHNWCTTGAQLVHSCCTAVAQQLLVLHWRIPCYHHRPNGSTYNIRFVYWCWCTSSAEGTYTVAQRHTDEPRMLGYMTANAPAAAKNCVCGCSTPRKGKCWTGVERVEHGEGRDGVQHLAQKWCCTCSTPPPELVLNMVCTTPAQCWTGDSGRVAFPFSQPVVVCSFFLCLLPMAALLDSWLSTYRVCVCRVHIVFRVCRSYRFIQFAVACEPGFSVVSPLAL